MRILFHINQKICETHCYYVKTN